MAAFFDIHTHQPVADPAVTAIVNLYWNQQQEETGSGHLRSVGLHPWHLEGFTEEIAKAWLEAQLARPGSVAVGEAGLDKITSTNIKIQRRAFQCCIAGAAERRLPLIIHCVRAYEEVLEMLHVAFGSSFPIPVIFHGFNKKPELAEQLLRAGCFLSFGPALLQNKPYVAKSLEITPLDRLFLETDHSTVLVHAVYTAAAAIKRIHLEDFCQKIQKNTSIFGDLNDLVYFKPGRAI
jgi:TatD DNase family protein